jgi:hypothetical protein
MKPEYPSNKTRQDSMINSAYRQRQKPPQKMVYRITPRKKSADTDRRRHNQGMRRVFAGCIAADKMKKSNSAKKEAIWARGKNSNFFMFVFHFTVT